MRVEAVLLTGGKSSRMGEDKSLLIIEGVPQAERIASQLKGIDVAVTVLGKSPLEGCAFLEDEDLHAGPTAALAKFQPSASHVFVASCDLPRFDARLVRLLAETIGDREAAVPDVNGFRQPLCALYRAEAFDRLRDLMRPQSSSQEGVKQCAMGWLDALETVVVPEEDIRTAGIDPNSAQGANTKEELKALLEG
jgi:molybdopterin-guanine dinucleotide biosynthesis protein A